MLIVFYSGTGKILSPVSLDVSIWVSFVRVVCEGIKGGGSGGGVGIAQGLVPHSSGPV